MFGEFSPFSENTNQQYDPQHALELSYQQIIALAADRFLLPHAGPRAAAEGMIDAAEILRANFPFLQPEPTQARSEPAWLVGESPTQDVWCAHLKRRLSQLFPKGMLPDFPESKRDV